MGKLSKSLIDPLMFVQSALLVVALVVAVPAAAVVVAVPALVVQVHIEPVVVAAAPLVLLAVPGSEEPWQT